MPVSTILIQRTACLRGLYADERQPLAPSEYQRQQVSNKHGGQKYLVET